MPANWSDTHRTGLLSLGSCHVKFTSILQGERQCREKEKEFRRSAQWPDTQTSDNELQTDSRRARPFRFILALFDTRPVYCLRISTLRISTPCGDSYSRVNTDHGRISGEDRGGRPPFPSDLF